MEYNEQYWKDYTTFINEVEKISALSPWTLLEVYQYLVEGLETGTLYTDIREWPEEIDIDEDGFSTTIGDVYKVVNSEILKGNLLYTSWIEKLLELDERMRRLIKPEYILTNEWKSWFRFKMLNDAH